MAHGTPRNAKVKMWRENSCQAGAGWGQWEETQGDPVGA